MKCTCCNQESHQGGIFFEEYSDVDDKEILNKLRWYLYDPNPMPDRENLMYRGFDLETTIRLRRGEIDNTKESINMVIIDDKTFSRLKEIWATESKHE